MSQPTSLAQVASLIGERARGEMLLALMSGRALTAKELAYLAEITPQTASGHLSKLVRARILTVTKQGRFHYFRLASPAVAQTIESILTVARPARRELTDRAGGTLASARLCYDHLAGKLAVGLAAWLIDRGYLILENEGGEVTPAGHQFFADFGMDIERLQKEGRRFCRPCLDWTERRYHLAGSIGAALAQHCFRLRWIQRVDVSRALTITKTGQAALKEQFGLAVNSWI